MMRTAAAARAIGWLAESARTRRSDERRRVIRHSQSDGASGNSTYESESALIDPRQIGDQMLARRVVVIGDPYAEPAEEPPRAITGSLRRTTGYVNK